MLLVFSVHLREENIHDSLEAWEMLESGMNQHSGGRGWERVSRAHPVVGFGDFFPHTLRAVSKLLLVESTAS